jgi:fructokinase
MMSNDNKIAIGLDIGGTKIAGAAFDDAGNELAVVTLPTPNLYEVLVDTCHVVVKQVETQIRRRADTVGACAPYADDQVCSNVPSLIGKNLAADLSTKMGITVPLANDTHCAALAEATEGAGKDYRAVLGLIMGTGFAAGFVLDKRIYRGANGQGGEIGHLPLPYYEESDGDPVDCACGQKGCIEKLIAGSGLSRLYKKMTGTPAMAQEITERFNEGEADARRVLDRYYTVVAKAMVTVFHAYDPEIIVVSGGLNALPGLYDEVPKRWGAYCVNRKPRTKFVPAAFGAMAGLRGAARLGTGS